MNLIQTITFMIVFLMYMTSFLLHTLREGYVYKFTTTFLFIPLVLRSIILSNRLAVDWGFILLLTTTSAFLMWGLSGLSDDIADGILNFGKDPEKTRKVYGAYIASLVICMLILIPMYNGGDPYAAMRRVKEFNSINTNAL